MYESEQTVVVEGDDFKHKVNTIIRRRGISCVFVTCDYAYYFYIRKAFDQEKVVDAVKKEVLKYISNK